MCWPWCKLPPCPCPQLCCCPGLPCCQVVGEAVNVEGKWGNSARFKTSFPCDEETHEGREVTYTFPASADKERPGTEHRTSKTAQMHLLSILYRMPGSATSGKFTAWIDPCHSVKSNARFAYELSASAKADHTACGVFEPSPLAKIFAEQFQFLAGKSFFSSGDTSSSGQTKFQAFRRLPLWKKYMLVSFVATLLLIIIIIAIATQK